MKKLLVLCALSAFLPSCAVVMAAKKGGTDIDSVQNICTRTQLQSLGAHLVASEQNEQGQWIEIYQIQQAQGSIARAVMHGLLDITTGFLWELIGTPIEGSLSEKRYYCVKVISDANGRVERIDLR